jgi:hypothetical protein
LSYPDANLVRRGEIRYVTANRQETRYRAMALLPRPVPSQDDSWDFYMAIRKQTSPGGDNLFTDRPSNVWAELQPRADGRDVEPPYQFYDADFLENQPIPVLRFRAENWPAAAKEATLKLWFAEAENGVLPDESRLVKTDDRFSIPGLPGVTFVVQTEPLDGNEYRVVVTELRQPSSEAEAVRVQLVPAPDRIEHERFFGVHRCVHRFDYAEQKSTRLQITKRSNIIRGAVDVPEIQITLPPR